MEAITGQKRGWEAGAPPKDGAPSPRMQQGGNPHQMQHTQHPGMPHYQKYPGGPGRGPGGPHGFKNGGGDEATALASEMNWLKTHNLQLQHQLAHLQQQHQMLAAAAAQQQQMMAAQAAAAAAAAASAASMGAQGAAQRGAAHPACGAAVNPAVQAATAQAATAHTAAVQPAVMPAATQPAAPSLPHNPAWTEQVSPENNQTYYWNSKTGESTWTRPPDFNPPPVPGPGGAQSKGPPGANLFVVRKMRRGEYDAFSAEDLRREFSRYGTVTRAEMTIDKETGWSKGFGFVSFTSPIEADAALAAIHGSWVDGREMKVEKTKEDGA